jgi:RHS repeat-associated protein
LTEVDQAEGGDWQFGYDSLGNRSSVVDPRENEATYEYDLLDRMTKSSEPLEVTTEYGYDASGDLTSVKDPRGYTTEYGYDKLGRTVEVAQPLEKTTTYSYDAAGNPLSKVTAAGTLEYEHDAANRLTAILAGETTLRSYGYDAANRRTSAIDAEGHKIEIGYNEDSLPSSIKDGRGQSLTRAYNSRGELAEQVDGRGTLKYEYDKLGRLTSLTDTQSKVLGFGYDPEGDLTEVTRPNGVTTTNVYNEAGRLAETTSVKGGKSPTMLESLKYGYDPAGNVTSTIDQRLEAETTYSYDALNRLTEFNPPGEGSTSYGYDEAGNRTEAGGITYGFNSLNQLTEASDGTTYGYDEAGRMIAKESEAGKTNYKWDLFDHLAKVEGPTETVNYSYDGLERLSERKGGGTQVFHYGDLSDLPTYVANGEGKVGTSYVSGPRGLVEQRSGEATAYPLADGHGDVTAISGPTGGVESRQEFGPWGEQLSGPSLEMGYLGAWERSTDPTTGLIQMGARSYDPALGQFTSEDPVFGQIGSGAAVNRYLYVWDNPLNRRDLNGRELCAPTPWGSACPGEGVEDVESAAEDTWHLGEEAANGIGSGAEHAWNWTAPGRYWIGNRAQDFWKNTRGAASEIYKFAGAHWQTCVEGGGAGATIGGTVGLVTGPEGALIGGGAGAIVGCGDLVQAEILLEIDSQ